MKKRKFRLVKEGEDSLKAYLRERYGLSRLAEEVGISNQALHPILNGDRKRPNPRNLERIAEVVGMKIGMDEKGWYFELDEGESPGNDGFFIDSWKSLPPGVRGIASEVLEMLSDPAFRGLVMSLLEVYRQKTT